VRPRLPRVGTEILLASKFRADYLARHLAQTMAAVEPPGAVGQVTAVPATGRSAARPMRGTARRGGRGAPAPPFAPRLLEKVRETQRQRELPLARRDGNVRGAFRARAGVPETVLLVDDVATSGATVRECARKLRGAGARTVLVWCFARASRDDVDLEPPAPPAAAT
jgi:glutamine phosphoribosylpyrophosphate amidotransferase